MQEKATSEVRSPSTWIAANVSTPLQPPGMPAVQLPEPSADRIVKKTLGSTSPVPSIAPMYSRIWPNGQAVPSTSAKPAGKLTRRISGRARAPLPIVGSSTPQAPSVTMLAGPSSSRSMARPPLSWKTLRITAIPVVCPEPPAAWMMRTPSSPLNAIRLFRDETIPSPICTPVAGSSSPNTTTPAPALPRSSEPVPSVPMELSHRV